MLNEIIDGLITLDQKSIQANPLIGKKPTEIEIPDTEGNSGFRKISSNQLSRFGANFVETSIKDMS